jgi:plastocyanin
VRASLRLSCAAALAALAFPSGALAGVKTLVFNSAPIKIGAFGVERGAQLVPSPAEDGYVVGMRADVFDLLGNPVAHTDVMLHHVVFAKLGTPDGTCSSFTDYEGRTASIPAERFYAEGEEHAQLALPAAFGYPNHASDRWALVYMLMNHHARDSVVQIQYTVEYATGEQRTAVKPLWLDVRNCRADPVFNVPGTGGPGSTFKEVWDYRVPTSGLLIAGGGHLHGGGLSVDVADTSCASLFTSYPTWGGIEPRPVMHEPGPRHMTQFSDPAGRPVRAGDVLRLTATYDNSRPHVRAMGIAMVFLAPAPVAGCRSYDSARPEPTTPEQVTIQLLKRPAGAVRRVSSTWVGDYAFGAQRVSVPRGTRFTWRFVGTVQHDVTLASGPMGLASPGLTRGTYSFRFTHAGTYRLFCSLHPSRMTQIVTVRRG